MHIYRKWKMVNISSAICAITRWTITHWTIFERCCISILSPLRRTRLASASTTTLLTVTAQYPMNPLRCDTLKLPPFLSKTPPLLLQLQPRFPTVAEVAEAVAQMKVGNEEAVIRGRLWTTSWPKEEGDRNCPRDS